MHAYRPMLIIFVSFMLLAFTFGCTPRHKISKLNLDMKEISYIADIMPEDSARRNLASFYFGKNRNIAFLSGHLIAGSIYGDKSMIPSGYYIDGEKVLDLEDVAVTAPYKEYYYPPSSQHAICLRIITMDNAAGSDIERNGCIYDNNVDHVKAFLAAAKYYNIKIMEVDLNEEAKRLEADVIQE